MTIWIPAKSVLVVASAVMPGSGAGAPAARPAGSRPAPRPERPRCTSSQCQTCGRALGLALLSGRAGAWQRSALAQPGTQAQSLLQLLIELVELISRSDKSDRVSVMIVLLCLASLEEPAVFVSERRWLPALDGRRAYP